MFPLKKVTVHKNGEAYFEREGIVSGTQEVQLEFKTKEMSEVLRTMRVVDEHGTDAPIITYETSKLSPSNKWVGMSIPVTNSMASLFSYLQGVNVTFKKEDRTVTGRVIGVTSKQTNEHTTHDEIELLVGTNDVVSLWVDDFKSFKILGDSLPQALSEYLDNLLTERTSDRSVRKVSILFSGSEEKRPVKISYVLDSPIWKSNYQIYINKVNSTQNSNSNNNNNNNKCSKAKSEFEITVEGSACVDNTSDIPWDGVTLTLASGAPITFAYDIYNPIVSVKRELSLGAALTFRQPPKYNIPPVNTPQGGFVFGGAAPPANPPQPTVFGFGAAVPAPAPAPQPANEDVPAAAPPQVNNPTQLGFGGGLSFGTAVATGSAPFQYKLKNTIRVPSQQAVRVPTIKGKVSARRIHHYNTTTNRMCVSLLFANTLGNVLDKGPVLVLQDNDFAGEGMIENYVAKAEEVLIPYSVCPEVKVTVNVSNIWAPRKIDISKGRLSGTQIYQAIYEYVVVNGSEEELDFALDHVIQDGWTVLKTTADEEVKLDKRTRRYFFNVRPLSTRKFYVKHNKEQRTATIWILNLDDSTLVQLENLFTTAIGEAIVDFFEAAKVIYVLHTDYRELKQQQATLLNEKDRLLHGFGNDRTSRMNELEDRIIRSHEAIGATYDKWTTKRASLLDSIESFEASVNFEESTQDKEAKFKLPALVSHLSLRQLLADVDGEPHRASGSIFRPDGVPNARRSDLPQFGVATATPASNTNYESTSFGGFGSSSVSNTGGTPSALGNHTIAAAVAPAILGGTSSPAPFGFGVKPPTTATATTALFGGSSTPSSFSFGTSQPASAPAHIGFGSAPTTTTATSFGASSHFGAAPATSAFGSPTPGTGFGTAPTSTFGSITPGTFGSTTPGTATTTGARTGFGSTTPTTGGFGTAPASTFGSITPGTFGSTTPGTATTTGARTGFGSTTPTTGGFGTPATTFGSTTPASGFGSATFGTTSPAATSGFGSNTNTSSLFGGSSTSSPFGVATSATTSNLNWNVSPGLTNIPPITPSTPTFPPVAPSAPTIFPVAPTIPPTQSPYSLQAPGDDSN